MTIGKKSILKQKASRYRGVYKCGKKWKSQIQIAGAQVYLGIKKAIQYILYLLAFNYKDIFQGFLILRKKQRVNYS